MNGPFLSIRNLRFFPITSPELCTDTKFFYFEDSLFVTAVGKGMDSKECLVEIQRS